MFRSIYGVDRLCSQSENPERFHSNVSVCSIGINVHIMPAHVMPIQCDCDCCCFFRMSMRFMCARTSSHSMLIFIVSYCCLLLLKLLLLILLFWCCCCCFCDGAIQAHSCVSSVCVWFRCVFLFLVLIHWHLVYGCVPNIISFADKRSLQKQVRDFFFLFPSCRFRWFRSVIFSDIMHLDPKLGSFDVLNFHCKIFTV